MSRFFPDPTPLWAMRPKHCEASYERLVSELAVDSHRNALAEVKTFFDWCVTQKWISANPAFKIVGEGKRKRRKTQLRVRDARIWYRKALQLANDGDDGAIAALMTIVVGLRCSEIVSRRVCDLDEDEAPCDLVWIPESKTEAGRRAIDVPSPLRELLAALVDGRRQDAPLFPTRTGTHWRDWPRHQVKRICKLAGVPQVTAHGMRGLLATITIERGAAAHLVAATLGHERERTTIESYANPGATDKARRRKALKVLHGGRK